MICSTSFLNKAIMLAMAGCFCLSGCSERCVVLGAADATLVAPAAAKVAPDVAKIAPDVAKIAPDLAKVVPDVAKVEPDVAKVEVPRFELKSLVLLPVQNWSGVKVPVAHVEEVMKGRLQAMGFSLLDEARREECMRRHRLRDTGGVGSQAALAFQSETGVQAILVTCVEAYQEKTPPRLTLHARLVTAEKMPRILWADSVGMNGNEAPGLLGLGLIKDPDQLLEKVVSRLALSLSAWLEAGKNQPAGGRTWRPAEDLDAGGLPGFGRQSRYLPRTSFRAKTMDATGHYTVAVIPFLSVSSRKYAEQIMAVHLVNELVRYDNITVLEPGVVREELLKGRAIMPAGPSQEVADLFFNREELGVNLILSGEVFDYQDAIGLPKVDFSLQAFEKKSRKTVWYSRSFNTADEGDWFFDVGKIYTAHGLAARMAHGAMAIMLQ